MGASVAVLASGGRASILLRELDLAALPTLFLECFTDGGLGNYRDFEIIAMQLVNRPLVTAVTVIYSRSATEICSQCV